MYFTHMQKRKKLPSLFTTPRTEYNPVFYSNKRKTGSTSLYPLVEGIRNFDGFIEVQGM